MKNLSSTNIWQLVRYYWRTEKKLYLRLYLGLVAIYLFKTVLFFFFGRIFSIEEMGGILLVLNNEWIFWGFILICTSRMFAVLEKKPTAITLLALPASNMTKFLTRVVYATIGIYLLALAARLTVNVINSIPLFFDDNWPLEYILRYQIFPGHWVIAGLDVSGLGAIFNGLSVIVFVMVLALWPWSLFTLFGLLFRRHGWLWAIPVLFVCISIFAIFVRVSNLSDEAIMSITFGIILTLSLLNYWLAYRCFCHAQIISNKLTRL